jgi:hypothetical protein
MDCSPNNVYYTHALIKGRSKPENRTFRLVVDSRDRCKTLFPNPSTYDINLIDDIPHVTSIQLRAFEFPFTSYLVNANNNTLHFSIGGKDLVAVVEFGDYVDGEEMAAAIQASMNEAVANDIFTVQYIPRTDNFEFSSTRSFSLSFCGERVLHPFNNNYDTAYPLHSIGRVLGFGAKNYESTSRTTSSPYKNVIKSEFRKNFGGVDTLVVTIEAFGLNRSTANSVNDSFFVVSKNIPFGTCDDTFNAVTFTPALPRLTKLRVRITDYDGKLYDFQNHDHRMEFVLEANIKNSN